MWWKTDYNFTLKLISPNTRQSGEIELLNQNDPNEGISKGITEG